MLKVGLTILTPTIITTISCNSDGSPTNNNSETPTLIDKQINWFTCSII